MITQDLKNHLAKLILRVTVGGLMIFHGIHKLINGHGHVAASLQGAGLPEFIKYGVPVGEVLEPLLMILGVLVRPSAAIVAFTM